MLHRLREGYDSTLMAQKPMLVLNLAPLCVKAYEAWPCAFSSVLPLKVTHQVEPPSQGSTSCKQHPELPACQMDMAWEGSQPREKTEQSILLPPDAHDCLAGLPKWGVWRDWAIRCITPERGPVPHIHWPNGPYAFQCSIGATPAKLPGITVNISCAIYQWIYFHCKLFVMTFCSRYQKYPNSNSWFKTCNKQFNWP